MLKLGSREFYFPNGKTGYPFTIIRMSVRDLLGFQNILNIHSRIMKIFHILVNLKPWNDAPISTILYNYIIENAILSLFQSRFVRGDAATNQLLHIDHTLYTAVDSGKGVWTAYCDISKALDRVWHRILLHKLSGIGCSNKITSRFLVT